MNRIQMSEDNAIAIYVACRQRVPGQQIPGTNRQMRRTALKIMRRATAREAAYQRRMSARVMGDISL